MAEAVTTMYNAERLKPSLTKGKQKGRNNMGPVEYVVIGFPGNRFNGDIAPAIQELVEAGIVNILDLVFIKKDADGVVTAVEIDQLSDSEATVFDSVDGEVGYLLNDSDLAQLAEGLPNNTSAGLLVWENAWAERFASAVLDSGGEVLARERIPYEVVQEAMAYLEGEAA
jgi:hypothetical protein